ncbi:hypothetical protein ACWDTP_28840 [Mycobacterium sp. NPDC003449]
MKSTMMRVAAGTALGGALFLSGMGIANAAPRDGQVDLALGTAGVLEDVPIGSAAQIAAGVCDTDVAQVTRTAETVDGDGVQQNVCNNTVGAVELRQNEATEEDTAQEPATEGTQGSETAAPESSSTPTTSAAPEEGESSDDGS